MTKKILFSVVIPICIFFSLVGYNNGGNSLSNADGTGAKGNGGCSCHGYKPTKEIGISIELDSAGIPVNSYIPENEYTIKLSGSNNSTHKLPKFGFRMAVVKADGSGTQSAVNAGNILLENLPEECQQIALGT